MKKINIQPKSWKELISIKEYIRDNDPIELRLPEDYIHYNLYKELVPKNIALEIIRRQMGKKTVTIVKNNFPYTKTLEFLPGVKHYCLWSLKGKLKTKEIKNITSKIFPQNEWFFTERKINYKSVPEIWHCHIFVKYY